MTTLKETLRDLHKDLNILQERQAKYAGSTQNFIERHLRRLLEISDRLQWA